MYKIRIIKKSSVTFKIYQILMYKKWTFFWINKAPELLFHYRHLLVCTVKILQCEIASTLFNLCIVVELFFNKYQIGSRPSSFKTWKKIHQAVYTHPSQYSLGSHYLIGMHIVHAAKSHCTVTLRFVLQCGISFVPFPIVSTLRYRSLWPWKADGCIAMSPFRT